MLVDTRRQENRLQKLAELIEIPQSYYETATARYHSIGDWLCRNDSTVKEFKPTVSVQGSFRLGLVVRPIGPMEEYDLDLVCTLAALTKKDVTQKQLKELLGVELISYASQHGIKSPVKDKKRCWRIDYADTVKFHIDNLPCIPEDADSVEGIITLGVPEALASTAIALTCKEHPCFASRSDDWPSSNPGGYAGWFESRFHEAGLVARNRFVERGLYESVDDVPSYALKTPLQVAIQILKRHRDFWARNSSDLKPISMILTTLSASAYAGEESVLDALHGILDRMGQFVRSECPRVPNPVNPMEDFADKWRNRPELEQNFWAWYAEVQNDFDRLIRTTDESDASLISESRWGSPFSVRAGSAADREPIRAPTVVLPSHRPPSPWSSNGTAYEDA